jgi:hypothetical protein
MSSEVTRAILPVNFSYLVFRIPQQQYSNSLAASDNLKIIEEAAGISTELIPM